MAVECLLAVRDPKLQRVLSGLLAGLGMQHHVVGDSEHALSSMQERRLDAVIVDCCGIPGGPDIIRQMRKLPANSRTIAFAILPSDATAEVRSATGAHFVLQHPLSIDLMTRSLRAARDLMLQERRRYFRCAVELSVTIGGSQELVLRTTNLSAGGMAVSSNPHLESNWRGKLQFALPDKRGAIAAQGEIAWMLPDRTAGIRFTQIADSCRTLLEQWISGRVADEQLNSE